jgi:hypothetical protein
MKYYAAFALLFVAPSAMAADALTTNGFVTAVTNQANKMLSDYVKNNPQISGDVKTGIGNTETQISGAATFIKANNPAPNAISPIQSFTIPAFPNLPK